MKRFCYMVLLLLALPLLANADCDHDYWMDGYISPTCTSGGYYKQVCQKCGDVQKEYVDGRPALGHDWKIREQVEPTCEKEGGTRFSCTRCGAMKTEKTSALGHNYIRTGRSQAATCVRPATYQTRCANCGDEKYVETSPATGKHVYQETGRKEPTCTRNGASYQKCETCDDTRTVVIFPKGHEFAEIERKAGTCTAEGYVKYKCKNCSETKQETLPAGNGHNWVENGRVKPATCVDPAIQPMKCSECGVIKAVEVGAATGKHVYQETSRKESTCTRNGASYQKCETCGDTRTVVIFPKSHEFAEIERKDATCTAEGYVKYKCKNCSETKQETLPAGNGHNWVENGRIKPATCVDPAIQPMKCSECGVIKAVEVGAATGEHDYEETGRTEPTCTSTGVIYRKCKDCGKTDMQRLLKTDHQFVETERKDATCTAEGYVKYKCKTCTETKQETLPAGIGHVWKESGRIKPATCVDPAVQPMKCSECGATKTAVIAEATGHQWEIWYRNEATCAEDGVEYYKCTACGEQKSQTLKATGQHQWEDESVMEVATCTREGTMRTACRTCAQQSTRSISALGHHYEEKVEVQPTCTAEGRSATRCTRCGEATIKTLDALGHAWQALAETQPTCGQDGARTARCTRCGEEKAEILKATGDHHWETGDVLEAATCAREGSLALFCRGCGLTDSQPIGKLHHQYSPWRIKVQATEERDGERERSCTVCGKTETAAYKLSDSYVRITTTVGKVNIRKGVGKKYRLAGTVDRKNTDLGRLLDAKLDGNGDVWYCIRYKKADRWVSAAYTRAERVNFSHDEERLPNGDGMELSTYYLCDIAGFASQFTLEMTADAGNGKAEYGDGRIRVTGENYVESIALEDAAYTLFGVRPGDEIKDAEKLLTSTHGMLLSDKQSGRYIFCHPCTPDSIWINEDGFDAFLEVNFDGEGRVTSITMETAWY